MIAAFVLLVLLFFVANLFQLRIGLMYVALIVPVVVGVLFGVAGVLGLLGGTLSAGFALASGVGIGMAEIDSEEDLARDQPEFDQLPELLYKKGKAHHFDKLTPYQRATVKLIDGSIRIHSSSNTRAPSR